MLEIIKEQEVLGRNFRVYGSWEEPLFLAKDVAEWIEYDASSVHKLVKTVDEEERVRKNVPTLGGEQKMWFLTEQGLYEVLLQSRKPIAKEFKTEVKKILKSVRLHGAYMTPEAIGKIIHNPTFLLSLTQSLIEEQEKNEVLTQEIQVLEIKAEEDRPKVAFAEAVSVADTTISVGELAKLIKQNGVEIGQQRLYSYFRECGYVTKRDGIGQNIPTQRAMDMGLFKINEVVEHSESGRTYIHKSTRVTGKGQRYFHDKLSDEPLLKVIVGGGC